MAIGLQAGTLIDTHRGPDWDDYRDALKEEI